MAAKRLTGLDGLRGMGAFLVLLLHLHFETGGLEIARRAYLAVDLFFILSGFVFSGAYDRKLASRRIGWFAFLKGRLARFFPAIAVGLLFGVLNFCFRGADYGVVASALICQAAMVPVLWISGTPAFPLNTPQWSLTYELAVNAFYAAIIRYLNGIALALIVAISAILYLFVILQAGSADVGAVPETMIAAIPRVTFGFFGGLLLGRIWHGKIGWKPRHLGLAAISIFPLSILLLQLLGANKAVGDACAVFLLFPAIVWFAASAGLGRRAARTLSAAGNLSYPLYAFHVPLLGIAGMLIRPFRLGSVGSFCAWAAAIAIIVATAWQFSAIEKAIRQYVRSAMANRGTRRRQIASTP